MFRTGFIIIHDRSDRKLTTAFTLSQELQRHLAGRSLLLSEIPFPLELIESHKKQGLITEQPGIIQSTFTFICQRCGNQHPSLFASFPCAHCGKTSIYCRKCIMMGRVATCTPLFNWIGPEPEIVVSQSPLRWDGALSSGQEVAAQAVVEAIRHSSEHLVWAVCGAGKTEILFRGINEALQSGKRICIATPRTDVVLELAPRLQQVFPTMKVAALYGGSPDRHVYAPLTITTTHQLYRFQHAFDVMIVDEVDAFPYTYDQTLQYAVQKAAKKQCAHIYLTATPNEAWQRECRSGKRSFTTIPARFHRQPLPVPDFRWIGNWRKQLAKGNIPHRLERWIKQQLIAKKQALLFLPNIHLMNKILPMMQTFHHAIESVHAEDPKRKEKIENMRGKQIPILLTTTILERGVTIPNIDVAVIGAEDDIFTEAALVQIAGRVGRSVQFPSGEITFFHYGRSKAMVQAKRHIMNMNREARRRGLLDE